MPKGSSKPSEFDPDFSHTIRGDVPGLEDDDGYHLYGRGDPEGDLSKLQGKGKNYSIFNDRRQGV